MSKAAKAQAIDLCDLLLDAARFRDCEPFEVEQLAYNLRKLIEAKA